MSYDVGVRLTYEQALQAINDDRLDEHTSPPYCPCCCRNYESVRVEAFNYTSNMAGAWDASGIPLRDMDGMAVAEAIPILRAGIANIEADIEADPEAYRKFEPDNGWGNVERMLNWLRRILALCEQWPEGKLDVSR